MSEDDIHSVSISLREYKSLLDDSEMLRHLYKAGVQDWEGYKTAIREMEKNA